MYDEPTERTPDSPSRRDFLRTAAIGGSAAAVAALPVAAEAGDVISDAPEEGYRLTPHIVDYYKSAV